MSKGFLEAVTSDLIKTVQDTQDMDWGEANLARNYPELYDLYVNGIRRIPVKDESQTVVYLWRYGKKVIGVE